MIAPLVLIFEAQSQNLWDALRILWRSYAQLCSKKFHFHRMSLYTHCFFLFFFFFWFHAVHACTVCRLSNFVSASAFLKNCLNFLNSFSRILWGFSNIFSEFIIFFRNIQIFFSKFQHFFFWFHRIRSKIFPYFVKIYIKFSWN